MENSPPTPPATAILRPGGRSWRAPGLLLTLTAVALITGGAASSTVAAPGVLVRGLAATAARASLPRPVATGTGIAAPTMPAQAPTGPHATPPSTSVRVALPTRRVTTTVLAHQAASIRPAATLPAPRRVVSRTPVATLTAAHPRVSAASGPASIPVRASPASPPAPAPPPSLCAAAIAAVEGRGLFPAPGFVVVCPGNALGHEGMTCFNVAGVCPGGREIVIHDPQPYVVANEFENSRILSGAPARCEVIDCGGSAYGY